MALKLLMTSMFVVCLFVTAGNPQESGQEPVCMDDEICGEYGTCDDMECVCSGRWGGIICNESNYCNQANPCNGGTCSTDEETNGGFNCDCTNTNFTGTVCNLRLCQTTTYNRTSFGDVTFDSVLQNEVSSSDVICEDGGFFDGSPVGTRKCGRNFVWEYPVFIQNCAANFANLSTFEKIDALLVVSSSLTNINEKKMSDLITNYNDVFEQARNTTEVSQLISTVNNFLQAEGGVLERVQDKKESLLDSLGKLATNVQLEMTSMDLNRFENIETDIAVAAVQKSTAYVARATDALEYSISLSDPLQPEDKLRAAEFGYYVNNSAPFQNLSLYASLKSNERVTFQLFSDDILFASDINDPDIKVESLIMGVGSSGSTDKLTLKFYLFQYYADLVNQNSIDERFFHCSSWNGNSWNEESDCEVFNITKSNLYNFVTCECDNQQEYFAVVSRKAVTVQPTVSTSLTDGEIAGIVIGSVAGAILVFGGIGYAVHRSNKKKKMKSQVIPMERKAFEPGSDEEMRPNTKNSSRRSSSSEEDD